MHKIKKGLSAAFDHISECMTPIIPIVLAGGIFKMIVLLPDFAALMESGEKVTFIGIPVVAWGLFAALTIFLVSTGMHWIFITLAITQIGLTGIDYGIMVAFLISNLSLAGCDLGVFVKTKNAGKKAISMSAMMAVLIPGISEPSIFGVCFKERTLMVGNVLGCMIAGVVQGILTVYCYIFTFPSIPSILIFYSADEPNNLMKAVIVAIVSFIASFAITAAIYRDADIILKTKRMDHSDEKNHVF